MGQFDGPGEGDRPLLVKFLIMDHTTQSDSS